MTTIDLPEAIQLKLQPSEEGSEAVTVDLFQLFDRAGEIQAAVGPQWIEPWGNWISSHYKVQPLQYSQARQLWELVSAVASRQIEECKKKADSIASSLCSTEGVLDSMPESPI